MKPQRNVREKGLPAWLEGVEECEECLVRVAHDVLAHCVACDRPMCPTCAIYVVERRTVLCAACAAGRS